MLIFLVIKVGLYGHKKKQVERIVDKNLWRKSNAFKESVSLVKVVVKPFSQFSLLKMPGGECFHWNKGVDLHNGLNLNRQICHRINISIATLVYIVQYYDEFARGKKHVLGIFECRLEVYIERF